MRAIDPGSKAAQSGVHEQVAAAPDPDLSEQAAEDDVRAVFDELEAAPPTGRFPLTHFAGSRRSGSPEAVDRPRCDTPGRSAAVSAPKTPRRRSLSESRV